MFLQPDCFMSLINIPKQSIIGELDNNIES